MYCFERVSKKRKLGDIMTMSMNDRERRNLDEIGFLALEDFMEDALQGTRSLRPMTRIASGVCICCGLAPALF